MKKTILLSLIVSSLVMGANTADNLVINQKSTITTNSTVDNATVHQGKTEILGSSDVDNLTIEQLGNPAGNLIEDTDVVGNDIDSPIIYQGYTKVNGSEVQDLKIKSINSIKNVGTIYGKSRIEQGNFIVTDSNATDSRNDETELDSLNTINNSSIDSSATDINGTVIKQSVVFLHNGAITDKLSLQYKSEISNSEFEDTEVFQGVLDVNNSSEVSGLTVRDDSGNNKAIQLLNISTIEGGSIHQNTISIDNNAYVSTLNSFTKNTIEHTTSINSDISQSETTIN